MTEAAAASTATEPPPTTSPRFVPPSPPPAGGSDAALSVAVGASLERESTDDGDCADASEVAVGPVAVDVAVVGCAVVDGLPTVVPDVGAPVDAVVGAPLALLWIDELVELVPALGPGLGAVGGRVADALGRGAVAVGFDTDGVGRGAVELEGRGAVELEGRGAGAVVVGRAVGVGVGAGADGVTEGRALLP